MSSRTRPVPAVRVFLRGVPMSASPLRDRVLLLLVNGMAAEAVEEHCTRTGQSPDAARALVQEARQRLTVAADYVRDEHLGRAILRLEDIYAKSITAQDLRIALQSQREINRLLGLYSDADRNQPAGDDAAAEALARVAAYLLPLGLVAREYPVEEHARLAADFVRRHSPPAAPTSPTTPANGPPTPLDVAPPTGTPPQG